MSDSKKPSPASNSELPSLALLTHEQVNEALAATKSAPGAVETNKQRSGLPAWTIEDIQRALRTYDRSPFQDVLAHFADACPDADSLAKWARKYPDRWATAVSHLSRVAGFSERRELAVSHLHPSQMSDSQLEDRLASIATFAGIAPARLLEAVDAVLVEGSVAPSPSPPNNDDDMPKSYAEFREELPSAETRTENNSDTNKAEEDAPQPQTKKHAP